MNLAFLSGLTPTKLCFQIMLECIIWVKVWPNPAHDIVQVSMPGMNETQIRLIDTSGRILRSINSTTKQTSVEVGELDAGMYLIEIISSEEDRVLGRKQILIR